MSLFTLTFLLAFILVILALMGLGIGWMITGKSKIRGGTCGRDPTKKKDPSCGENKSCGLCEDDDDKK